MGVIEEAPGPKLRCLEAPVDLHHCLLFSFEDVVVVHMHEEKWFLERVQHKILDVECVEVRDRLAVTLYFLRRGESEPGVLIRRRELQLHTAMLL